jgi:carbamoyl-phosphate synthase large subunit
MSYLKNDFIRIAVTGGGALLGQGILRAIQTSNLRCHTIAVDVNALSAGLHWADEAFLVPPAKSPRYIESIRSLLLLSRPDILLVGTDVELAVLAEARYDLESDFGTRILVSSQEVVAIADDKYATARFFSANGFPFPSSALASKSEDVEELIAMYGFPLIVKPCVGARSYGVSLVRDRSELKTAIGTIENAVVQECVGENGQEFTASGLYFDGRCDAVVVMRRDLRDGNTYRAFTVKDTFLDNLVKQWTEALKPFGPANFQFRIDKFGVPKVFEINSRFSGTTPLRALVGFNEVEMCVRKLLWGESIVQPDIQLATIIRHWSETVIDPISLESVSKVLVQESK